MEGRGLDEGFVDEHLNYFKDRYVEGNDVTNRYHSLHLRRNDSEPLVRGALMGEVIEPESKLACCLIIVLRFRNNYFHGKKWEYQFQEQKENFERACCLLMWCMDQY